MKRRTLLIAATLWTVCYTAHRFALHITPVHPESPAQVEGRFTQGDGWHPGEPLVTARPLRAWGSWCGADENTGALTIGPFAAPSRLRVAISGYPLARGNELWIENVATKTRRPIATRNAHERWELIEHTVPREWRGQPVVIRAIDNAQQHAGWLAVSEPLTGGRDSRGALISSALALIVPAALLVTGMRRAKTGPPAQTGPRVRPASSWLLGLAALVPFALCAKSFADVWWFGDEWDQLDLIARDGFWTWTIMPFGENIVPLFKLLWGGMVFVSGGSYLPMLAVVWLTHALNTALFARLLLGNGFGWAGTSLATGVFALTVANAEVLGWAVQWSNLLAVSFLLLGFDWLLRHPPRAERWDWKTNGVLASCAAASALTFVRGILTGAVLAFGALFLIPRAPGRIAWRWRSAAIVLAPTLVIAVWISVSAPGNHQQLARAGLWRDAAEFGMWFWAAVPFHRLLEFTTWEAPTTVLLGSVKLVLIGWGLRYARDAQRALLWLLVILDLGNAVLLGLGRHQTGLQFANSSRYYYTSLICTLPFVALAFEALLGLLRGPSWRHATAGLAIGLAGYGVARGWPAEAELFAQHRGRNTRELLLRHPAPPAEGAVPGIPFLRTERAKELIARYNLH